MSFNSLKDEFFSHLWAIFHTSRLLSILYWESHFFLSTCINAFYIKKKIIIYLSCSWKMFFLYRPTSFPRFPFLYHWSVYLFLHQYPIILMILLILNERLIFTDLLLINILLSKLFTILVVFFQITT